MSKSLSKKSRETQHGDDLPLEAPSTMFPSGADTDVPAAASPRPRADERAPLDPTDMDEEEIEALICGYFCEGKSPSEIAVVLNRRHGLKISREVPYKYLNQAARSHRFRFVPRDEDHLTARLRTSCPWLKQVAVVHTASIEGVADRAAAEVLALIKEVHQKGSKTGRAVHVGFSGGNSMSLVARNLSVLLRQSHEGLPDKIVFHSLAAGFDPGCVTTDPGGFLAWLVDDPNLRVKETGFVGLRAPAIVHVKLWKEMLNLPGIREARDQVKDLDIIITAAGVMADKDSMLHRYYDKYSRKTFDYLRELGCVGDMLWLPLTKTAPICFKHIPRKDQEWLHRSMTILDLDELPDLIKDRTEVVLTLGPCTFCFEDKSPILDAILNQDPARPLITRLVADSRSVRKYLRARDAAKRG